ALYSTIAPTLIALFPPLSPLLLLPSLSPSSLSPHLPLPLFSLSSPPSPPLSSPQHFWLFLLTRGLVGVGEASYSTIAPTLIADLFVSDQRSRMLSVFYFAIPVGSGLGYIAGSKVTSAAGGNWHWALRVTPGLGLLAVLLLLIVVKEPPRGAVERKTDRPLAYTSWWSDVKALSKNSSFILSTFGFTSVAFVTGSLALWAPSYLMRSRRVIYSQEPCLTPICNYDDSIIFGVITCVSGILGVGAGVEISKRYRKINPRADPLVCALGLLSSAPFLFLAVACADRSLVATYVSTYVSLTLSLPEGLQSVSRLKIGCKIPRICLISRSDLSP
ncbi:hypothetical protein FKM82_024824, partial [Ascaphus truei]